MNSTQELCRNVASCIIHAALCLVVALLQFGGPSEVCRAAEEKTLPSDLALEPSDGTIFITIRVGDLTSSKLGKELLSQTRRIPENAIADLEKNLGVPLADVDRLTVLPGKILVIRTSRAFDREKLLDVLAPNGQRKKYQDNGTAPRASSWACANRLLTRFAFDSSRLGGSIRTRNCFLGASGPFWE
jgi:hypothetical protein